MPKSSKCHLRIIGPKSARQEAQTTQLDFSIEKEASDNGKLLTFLHGPAALPSGANFEFDQNQTEENCEKLFGVHFATGKLAFAG